MANGDNSIAQGILQAGQAIGQGFQQLGARRQQNQQKLQQEFDRILKRRDSELKIAGDKGFSKSVRQRALNRAHEFGSAIGFPLLGSKGEFEETEDNFAVDISRALEKVEKGTMTRGEFNSFINETRTGALERAQQGGLSGSDETEAIQDQFAQFQEQAFGAGTPQQFGTGIQQTLGRVTPSGQVAPITQGAPQQPGVSPQPQRQPVTQPNEFVIKTLQAREKTFKDDKVFQEVRKQLIDSQRLKALIEANIPGSIGPIVTQRAKASGEQRITDQDVVRFAGDPSAVATVKRFIASVRSGKLPTGDQETFIAMQRVIEGIARERLQSTLDSFTNTTSKLLPGVPKDQIRGFLSASVESDLKAAQFEESLDTPQKIKEAVRNRQLGPVEAKQILQKRFGKRFKK